jgi:hypothetical protein
MVHGMPSADGSQPSTNPAETQPSTQTSDSLPRKRILSPAHLAAFKESDTYKDIVGFVEELNGAIVGKKLSDAKADSPVRIIVLSVRRD